MNPRRAIDIDRTYSLRPVSAEQPAVYRLEHCRVVCITQFTEEASGALKATQGNYYREGIRSRTTTTIVIVIIRSRWGRGSAREKRATAEKGATEVVTPGRQGRVAALQSREVSGVVFLPSAAACDFTWARLKRSGRTRGWDRPCMGRLRPGSSTERPAESAGFASVGTSETGKKHSSSAWQSLSWRNSHFPSKSYTEQSVYYSLEARTVRYRMLSLALGNQWKNLH
uniref:Uncharacterized protein n=1 Tax=Sphaerodactylus townsendi TaxID=933632 RepID=A0ACB8G337_9SAUR